MCSTVFVVDSLLYTTWKNKGGRKRFPLGIFEMKRKAHIPSVWYKFIVTPRFMAIPYVCSYIVFACILCRYGK